MEGRGDLNRLNKMIGSRRKTVGRRLDYDQEFRESNLVSYLERPS